MNLFTYLLAKKDKNSLPHKGDLFSYLLGKKRSILPYEYQQVEYIESSGTQYIDTGYKPSNHTEYNITCSMTRLSSNIVGLIGIFSNNDPLVRWNIYLNSSKYIAVGYGSSYFASTIIPTLDQVYNIILNKTSFKIDNEIIEEFTEEEKIESNLNTYIFRRNSPDNVMASMKLYACKIYEDDLLVRNFVPCYRKSDNEVGLYDLVTKEFYTNQGTDEFTYQ